MTTMVTILFAPKVRACDGGVFSQDIHIRETLVAKKSQLLCMR